MLLIPAIDLRKGRTVRRILANCLFSKCPELLARVGLEQVRAAVNGMNRLPLSRFSGKFTREIAVRVGQPGRQSCGHGP